jgi:hypothetical protein
MRYEVDGVSGLRDILCRMLAFTRVERNQFRHSCDILSRYLLFQPGITRTGAIFHELSQACFPHPSQNLFAL